MRNIGQIGVEKDRRLSTKDEKNMRQTLEGEVMRRKFGEHLTTLVMLERYQRMDGARASHWLAREEMSKALIASKSSSWLSAS